MLINLYSYSDLYILGNKPQSISIHGSRMQSRKRIHVLCKEHTVRSKRVNLVHCGLLFSVTVENTNKRSVQNLIQR